MAGLWVILIAVVLLVLLAFVVWARRRFSRNPRRRLDSRQAAFYSPKDVHVVTALACSPELQPQLPELVRRLVERVKALNGKEVYVGRVLVPWVLSHQMQEDVQSSMQVVLVTQWRSMVEFGDFKSSELDGSTSWTVCWSTGIKRNPVVNFMLPCLLGTLQMISCILRRRYDLETPTTSEPTSGYAKEIYDSMIRRHVLDKVKGADPAEDANPVLVWNFILQGDPAQRRSDNAYSMKMMSMLSSFGAGVMDYGEVHHPEGTAVFDMVASVHYPNRRFVVMLSNSQWMHETVEGKQPADNLALITVPFL